MEKKKKGKISNPTNINVGKKIKNTVKLDDGVLRFSFKHFDTSNSCDFNCFEQHESYWGTLFDRLKSLSSWKITEFRNCKSPSVRAHTIDWSKTAKPKGFNHLNKVLQSCEPWQFSLSSNEHGRVHGFIIDHVFFVVWFDSEHSLYP